MDDSDRWYFAYGSNMQAATLRGRRRIEPRSVRVGYLHGYRLCFDIPIGGAGRGVANLSLCPGEGLWGVLYLLTAEQHDHLDRTEGVPALYRRIDVEVVSQGETVAAETLMSELRDPSRLPSHRYRGLLLDGAREHGLPQPWVQALEEWALSWDEREGASNPGLTPPDLALPDAGSAAPPIVVPRK